MIISFGSQMYRISAPAPVATDVAPPDSLARRDFRLSNWAFIDGESGVTVRLHLLLFSFTRPLFAPPSGAHTLCERALPLRHCSLSLTRSRMSCSSSGEITVSTDLWFSNSIPFSLSFSFKLFRCADFRRIRSKQWSDQPIPQVSPKATTNSTMTKSGTACCLCSGAGSDGGSGGDDGSGSSGGGSGGSSGGGGGGRQKPSGSLWGCLDGQGRTRLQFSLDMVQQ